VISFHYCDWLQIFLWYHSFHNEFHDHVDPYRAVQLLVYILMWYIHSNKIKIMTFQRINITQYHCSVIFIILQFGKIQSKLENSVTLFHILYPPGPWHRNVYFWLNLTAFAAPLMPDIFVSLTIHYNKLKLKTFLLIFQFRAKERSRYTADRLCVQLSSTEWRRLFNH